MGMEAKRGAKSRDRSTHPNHKGVYRIPKHNYYCSEESICSPVHVFDDELEDDLVGALGQRVEQEEDVLLSLFICVHHVLSPLPYPCRVLLVPVPEDVPPGAATTSTGGTSTARTGGPTGLIAG
jgi:hypothetical protein